MTKSIPKKTEGSQSFHKKLKLVVRRAGKTKPCIEQILGDDFHRNSGKVRNLIRVIDKENDHYREFLTDKETGEILHECNEPLSKHQGHGAARIKQKNNSQH
jgi:hypothetical protein